MTTPISQWRARNRPQEIELPSGNVALIRKVHVVDLAMQGEIPSTLVAEARAFTQSGAGSDPFSDPDALQRWLKVIDPVIKAAFVEPKVGDEATDEQLALDEVETMDKLAVFRYCNEGVEEMRPFRVQPPVGVGPAPDGGDVRDTA